MPIKITYDLNNEQECKLIDDYYFFKYYLKSLIFDWEKCFYTKDYDPSIIKAHLNITEFNRFIKLYQMILAYFYDFNDYDFQTQPERYIRYYQSLIVNIDKFEYIFSKGKNFILKIYKSYIKYKLPNK